MTFVVASAWLERMFDGTAALDFDATGASDFQFGIATNTSFDPDADSTEGDLTPVSTGDDWTGPVSLASETCGLDGSNDLLFDAADPSQIAQDADNGFSNGRTLYIKENASDYIICAHVEGSSFGNVAGPINISWPSGIWKLTI